MPVYPLQIRLFTVEEANQALPRLRELLAELRRRKAAILSLQARADIAEMTGPLDAFRKAGWEADLAEVDCETSAFHLGLKQVNALGCELKDLDKGRVDFYASKEGETVCLCWTEEEEQVRHWHHVQDGYEDRKNLES